MCPKDRSPQSSESEGGIFQDIDKSSKVAIRATRRKYAFKKVKLDMGPAPLLKKRSLVLGSIALLLAVIGVPVLSHLLGSGVSRYKPRPERWIPMVKKEVNSLAIALGRYRIHVGAYPTDEEGLKVLACRQPEELSKIRRAHPGWDGPYVTRLQKDPWGKEFVYEPPARNGDHPILYSCGPDRKAWTPDDILPSREAFDQPFRDTSWTNNWLPVELRVVIKNSAYVNPKLRSNTEKSPKAEH